MNINTAKSKIIIKNAFHPRAFALVIATTIGAAALTSAPTNASGFPTVDIAQVVQNLEGYMQQLEEYSTQLEQQITQQSQLVQAVNQYEQMMVDYDHYLTLVRGLQEYVDVDHLKSLAQRSLIDESLNPFSDQFDPTIYTDEGVVNIDNELKRLYHRSRQLSSMQDDIAVIGGDTDLDETAEYAFENSQLATLQASNTEQLDDEINDNITATSGYQNSLDNIIAAPESQVATLQMIAQQNQAILGNLQTLAKIANAELNYANQLPNKINSNLARSKDAQVQRLRYVVENPPVAHTSGFDEF